MKIRKFDSTTKGRVAPEKLKSRPMAFLNRDNDLPSRLALNSRATAPVQIDLQGDEYLTKLFRRRRDS